MKSDGISQRLVQEKKTYTMNKTAYTMNKTASTILLMRSGCLVQYACKPIIAGKPLPLVPHARKYHADRRVGYETSSIPIAVVSGDHNNQHRREASPGAGSPSSYFTVSHFRQKPKIAKYRLKLWKILAL